MNVEGREGVFDAVLYKLLDENELSADTIFECQLALPDTDYQLIQRLNFQPSKTWFFHFEHLPVWDVLLFGYIIETVL